MEELTDIKRIAKRMQVIMLVIGIVGCLLAIGTQLKAVAMFLTIGSILVIMSIVTLIRVGIAKDVESVGRSTIQGTWAQISCGLAWLLLPHAPYFNAPIINWIIALILGLVVGFYGTYILLQAKKKTGVMLSI